MNKNIIIVFRVAQNLKGPIANHWIKPQNFPSCVSNPIILDFSYSPFCDSGSFGDIKLFIGQRLDDKNIPYDKDLNIDSIAEMINNSKSRIQIESD